MNSFGIPMPDQTIQKVPYCTDFVVAAVERILNIAV